MALCVHMQKPQGEGETPPVTPEPGSGILGLQRKPKMPLPSRYVQMPQAYMAADVSRVLGIRVVLGLRK